MGTPDFAVPSLRFMEKNYNIVAVYSQPARPSGRGMKTKLSSVEKNAKELNLKTITPLTLKQDDVFLEFKNLKLGTAKSGVPINTIFNLPSFS